MNWLLQLARCLVRARHRLTAYLCAFILVGAVSGCASVSAQYLPVSQPYAAAFGTDDRPANATRRPDIARDDDGERDRDSMEVSARGQSTGTRSHSPQESDDATAGLQSAPTASNAEDRPQPIAGISLPATSPLWLAASLDLTPTPSPAPNSASTLITYTVASGDTLSMIAARFGISLRTILRANGMAAGDILPAGSYLLILPTSGILHRVAEGETVDELAERYRVIPEEIVAANGLVDSGQLQAGKVLLIPEADEADPADEDRPASAVRARQEYDVRAGDTLIKIAARFGLTLEALLAANRLPVSKPLTIGQRLTIPPLGAVEHVVQRGDTVTSIAARYGASAKAIIQENGLSDPYVLTVGQTLLVPGASPPPDTTPSAAAPTPTPTRPIVTPTPTTGTRLVYVVVAGDTLTKIAARYGVSVVALIAANGLDTAKPLAVGQRLNIPVTTPTASAPTATPAPLSTPAYTRTPAPAATPTPTRAPSSTATVAPSPQPTQTPADRSSVGERAATIAMTYIGTRYLWGGTSPATGFDCSGFVMFVYRQAGVPVPRDLWGQLNGSTRVERSALRRGDIVFFQNTYKPGLSHDGIYLGGGQFIHAASERTGVIVSRLDNPYWASHYLAAARP